MVTYYLYILVRNVIFSKKLLKVDIKILKNFLKIAGVGTFSFSICFSMYLNICFIKSPDKHADLEHFRNIKMEDAMYFSIKQMDDFILRMESHGKKVYILDALSPMFTIPLNRYNKDYDMFNLGNFGSKGTKGIIEDIAKKQDVLFLILQEEKNWQHPIEITDYVRENAKLIGDINLFDIYEK